MAGITDIGMRRLAWRFGAALTVTEMVAGDYLLKGDRSSLLRVTPDGGQPHVVQIAGCSGPSLAEAARHAEASGADAIDINMGCPAKRVTGGLAGSALMRDLDEATRLIAAAVAAVSVPVTVKMRLGWDERSRNAAELARRAEQEGVGLVTVHGRTRQQFYKGRADWGAVAEIKRAVTIPVVVNGDCLGPDDARVMLAASGADAVMIGRGALGRPWLVGEVDAALAGRAWHPPSWAARRHAALDHYETLLDLFGVDKGMRHARKHLAAYAEHVAAVRPDMSEFRGRLLSSEDPVEVKALLAALFEPMEDITEIAA